VLLMTIQNPPPTLEQDSGKKHFSKYMRDVVAKCLVKDPARRPTAAQLLEHKFFKVLQVAVRAAAQCDAVAQCIAVPGGACPNGGTPSNSCPMKPPPVVHCLADGAREDDAAGEAAARRPAACHEACR
jgi:serine/threonine protein kinase